LDVIGLLDQKGGNVSYHDPYVPHIKHDTWDKTSVPDLMQAVRDADCVVIITNHSSYDYPALLQAVSTIPAGPIIVDTRNALGSLGRDHPRVYRL
jgi:UDP-N-acetyl-D-glucosamine dehydrogenase